MDCVRVPWKQEINPYFLFFRGIQMGGKERAKPQMGGMPPLGAAPGQIPGENASHSHVVWLFTS